jgi:hypothetical protein
VPAPRRASPAPLTPHDRALVLLRTDPEFGTVPVDHATLADEVARGEEELYRRLHPELRDVARAREVARRNVADGVLIAVVAAAVIIAVEGRRSRWLTALGAVAEPAALTAVLLLLLVVAASAGYRMRARVTRVRRAEERLEVRLATELRALLRQIINDPRACDRTWLDKFDTTSAPALVDLAGDAAIPSTAYAHLRDVVAGQDASAVAVVGWRGGGRTTLIERLLSDPGLSVCGVYVQATRNPDELVGRVYDRLLKAAREWLRDGHAAGPVLPYQLARMLRVQRRRLEFARTVVRIRAVRLAWAKLGVDRSGQVTEQERERTQAAWLDQLRDLLVDLHLHTGRPIVVCVDGLDAAAGESAVVETIGILRHLFRTRGIHVVVSVPAEALPVRAASGRTVREVVEESFEAVVRVPDLTLDGSRTLLARRATGFPAPVAMFCHAWSGGNPRALIATALACVSHRRSAGRPLTTAEVVDRVLADAVVQGVEAALADARRDADDVEPLLAVRAGLAGEVRGYAGLTVPPGPLASCLAVAATTSRFFHAPRTVVQWREPDTARLVELLAQARAAVALSGEEVRRHLSQIPIPD